MKTKLLALCLAAVLSVMTLAACGAEETVETEPVPAETVAETVEETVEETEPETEAPKKRDKRSYIDM